MGYFTTEPEPEQLNVAGKDDQALLLLESVAQRIQKHNCSNRTFWQEHVGNRNADEAELVYEHMVKDVDQLNRILVARKHDLKASTDLFLEQVKFRAKWRPLEITPASIPDALPSGAWRLCGYSREGCVVSNYKLKYWNPDDYADDESDQQLEDSIDQYTRYVVYMIELMILSMKAKPVPQQFVVIFDLEGFYAGLAFRRNVRLMIRKLIYVAQAQYPERLHKCLLVNAPYGFQTAWKLIRPLLDAKTASKIKFCSNDAILNEIDPAHVSQKYGGTRAEYPVPSKRLEEERIVQDEA